MKSEMILAMHDSIHIFKWVNTGCNMILWWFLWQFKGNWLLRADDFLHKILIGTVMYLQCSMVGPWITYLAIVLHYLVLYSIIVH